MLITALSLFQNTHTVRFRIQLLLLFAVAFLSGTAHSATRHLWVWNGAAAIAGTGTARTDLLNFCAAPHGDPSKAITVIYLYAHTQITNDVSSLRSFLAEAHAAGLQVHFLDGDPDWAASDSSRLFAEGVFANVLTFNGGGTTNQRFDGIQYDVEPYLLPGWTSQESSIWARFVTLLQNCQDQVDAYNSVEATPIILEAAIPRWYDSDASTITSSSQVQDITDGVVIMDYTDQAAPLIADASTELSYANTAGKRVTVGVETGDVSPEPATVTFFDETVHAMEQRLAVAETTFLLSPSYQGFAIHHYGSYPNQELPVDLTAFSVE